MTRFQRVAVAFFVLVVATILVTTITTLAIDTYPIRLATNLIAGGFLGFWAADYVNKN